MNLIGGCPSACEVFPDHGTCPGVKRALTQSFPSLTLFLFGRYIFASISGRPAQTHRGKNPGPQMSTAAQAQATHPWSLARDSNERQNNLAHTSTYSRSLVKPGRITGCMDSEMRQPPDLPRAVSLCRSVPRATEISQ